MLNINGNVIIASAPAIFVAGITSLVMDNMDFSKEATTWGAIIADFVAYVPINIWLHYKSNKNQFMDDKNKFNKIAFSKDVCYLYYTQFPAIVLFYVLAGPVQYWLMAKEFSGGVANQISYWASLAASRTLHTLIGMKSGLFYKKILAESSLT